MAHLIDKDALVAEIKRQLDCCYKICAGNLDFLQKSYPEHYYSIETYKEILSFIDTLEVKGVDLELITGWFDHIAQIADDRMTLTNQRMTDAHALDEIKCLAKNSSEFITEHYKAQKGK